MTDLSAFEPNVEAIAGYEPDLVVTEGTNPDLVAQLDVARPHPLGGPGAGRLRATSTPRSSSSARSTGHVGEAAELVAQMQTDIDEIVAGMPALEEPLSVYHELDTTYFSATSDTFIGQVYNLLGLRNIADEAEGTGGRTRSSTPSSSSPRTRT